MNGNQMNPHPKRKKTGQHLCLGQLFTRALAGLESLRAAGPKLLVPLINKRSWCSRPVLFVRETRLDSCWMYSKERIHESRCLAQIFNYHCKSHGKGSFAEMESDFYQGHRNRWTAAVLRNTVQNKEWIRTNRSVNIRNQTILEMRS